jgi:hypothetical protein
MSRRKRANIKRYTGKFKSKVAKSKSYDTINNRKQRSSNYTPPQEPGCGCGRNK